MCGVVVVAAAACNIFAQTKIIKFLSNKTYLSQGKEQQKKSKVISHLYF